ncbi:hypothetical protein EXIGLDRAFT_832944 [Exidia glandulosa HHB12029]|uniref:Membrane-associated proteins in eicosanoid and glutathione metabolism n=1 Tax=Exidia glandulosa HHB12029 TaxID=1314781 RepID=A0A165L5T1_EXIGL|nr:hypothetical protein EXIGLDRAFT_832944 [Exidia glandulosa HHB12029]
MPAASFIDTPLSFFSIPLIWLAAQAPARMRVNAINGKVGYNNLAPRKNIERLEKDPNTDKEFLNRIIRLEGAHQNGLEAFPLWAVAVIAGNVGGMENRTLNICSALYVAGRFLYIYVYLNQKTRAQSIMRTGVWALTTAIPLYVLVHSAIIRRRWTY